MTVQDWEAQSTSSPCQSSSPSSVFWSPVSPFQYRSSWSPELDLVNKIWLDLASGHLFLHFSTAIHDHQSFGVISYILDQKPANSRQRFVLIYLGRNDFVFLERISLFISFTNMLPDKFWICWPIQEPDITGMTTAFRNLKSLSIYI